MGTRNLTMVMLGGKYVVAQYGQWDGHPDGQGVTALKFARDHLRVPAAREAFKDRLARVQFCDQATIERMHAECGATDDERNHEFRKRYPYFTRDNGAEILELIWNAKGPVHTRDETAFAADSLMCEWAYVIDLDKGTFEVFKGFNAKPLEKGARFAELPCKAESFASGNEYHPVRELVQWPLHDLPTQKAFIARCAELTKDDDDE